MGNKVTIEDIAQILGISKATVSRAISGKGRVSEATRNEVMRVMAEQNYQPISAPKDNTSVKSGTIAAVMPSDFANTSSTFFLECLFSVFSTANNASYDVIITSDAFNDVDSVERLVKSGKIDGLIFLRSTVLDNYEKLLSECKMPFVMIGAPPRPDIHHVDNDNITASRELTEHLLDMGCKRIAFLGPDINSIAFNHRMKGYVEAYRAHDMDVDPSLIHMNLKNEQLVINALLKLMNTNPPDAIITADDTLCYWTLMNLDVLNLTIPKDVKIASFNDSSVLSTHQPAITAVNVNPQNLGDKACRVLLRLIEGADAPVHSYVPYEIILRRSTL